MGRRSLGRARLEPVRAVVGRIEAIEPAHRGKRGSAAAGSLHIPKRGRIADEERFHRAVAAVAHPAAHAALAGLALDEVAEANALHAARYHDADGGHDSR